jgi:uncharacterized protein YkwD
MFWSLILTVLTVSACVGSTDTHDEVSESSQELRQLDAEEAEFLRLINAHRAANGNLPPLTATPLLNQVAYDHSLDMAKNKYFDHNDLNGVNPFDRMKNAGYQGGWMAENIAAGNETAAKTFEQWKNSSGHNANMLGTHYTAIGIGRAYDAASPYRWYWTTDFGDKVDGSVNTPIDPPPPPPPQPDPDPEPDPDTCDGTPEAEPNDNYATPNALSGAVCGEVSSSSDVDWYGWNLSAGAKFSVQVSEGVQLKLWRKIGSYYYVVATTDAVSASGTANRNALYIARVTTSGPTPAPYRIALTK